MNANTTTLQEKFEAARARVQDSATANLSISTVNRRWREYFAIEDLIKSLVVR